MNYIPKINEVMDLSLDGKDNWVDPMAMVNNFGYDVRGWRHIGKRVTEMEIRRLMLVSVGACPDFMTLKNHLETKGRIPSGQWLEAFKNTLKHDGDGPVGVADASWQCPEGEVKFPGIRSNGRSDFFCINDGFHANWRWLVEVS